MEADASAALVEPERMNLLGLILHSLVERNLQWPELALRAGKLRGAVWVQAGAMRVTLDCAGGQLLVRRGFAGAPRARVRGDLESFLKVALGRGLVGPVLSGRVRVGGNPFFLLRLLPLLRSKPA